MCVCEFCFQFVYEAQQTVRLLNDPHDNFEVVFLTPLPFWLRYDYYLSIDAQQMSSVRVEERRIISILEEAYCDRILFLHPQPRDERVWSLSPSSSPPPERVVSTPLTSSPSELVVGLRVNAAHYRRLVDRGPPADDVERVRQWCDFWGPKAQIRRFQDGSILQCAGTFPTPVLTNSFDNLPLPSSSSSLRADGGFSPSDCVVQCGMRSVLLVLINLSMCGNVIIYYIELLNLC